MGGVGYKYFPRRWWLPILKRVYHHRGLTRLVALKDLKTWVNEGKMKAIERPSPTLDRNRKASTKGDGGRLTLQNSSYVVIDLSFTKMSCVP